MTTKDDGTLRSFETGATRDTNEGKLDFEGFLSPDVLHQFARYMNMNRLQSDGNLRDSDNWQKGMPFDVYMKSGFRHFFEWWIQHRTGGEPYEDRIAMVGAICGVMFNCMGYLHEWLKYNDEVRFDDDEPTPEMRERQERLSKEKQAGNFVSYTNAYTREDKDYGKYDEVPLPSIDSFPTIKEAIDAIITDEDETPPCFDNCKEQHVPYCSMCEESERCDEYACETCGQLKCGSYEG